MTNSPLHVGYLIHPFLPEIGAAPARVGEMAAHWIRAGVKVTVITAMPHRPEGRIQPGYRGRLAMREDINGMNVLRSWLYASPKHGFLRTVLNNTSFMVTGTINGLARARGIDVLIASSPPFFTHIAGTALSAALRVPLVLEVRDLWPDYIAELGVVRSPLLKRGLFALERWMLRRADEVVVVTQSFRDRMTEKGVDPARISVVTNGVDVSQYFATDEPLPLNGFPRERKFVVGYIGNMGVGQRLGTVLDTAALLAERSPDVHFVVAGDGPEREALTRRAGEMQLPNLNVYPPLPKEQTRAFYNGCDVCLVPLAPVAVMQDTIPSKLFEILACGRPVIGSFGGEPARILEESGAGIVVPPGDPAALAAAIETLRAKSAAERAAVGARGSGYVAEHYSREVLAGDYLQVIQRAAGRRKSN